MNELRTFFLAVQFLTRLPVPDAHAYSPRRLAAAVRYYPLVGALIGGLCAAVFWLAHLWLPHSVAVLMAVATGLAATGALHEDGLADTFDGIGAAANDRDRALKIMRDSRLGTYGATALIVALGLKLTMLVSLAPTTIVAGMLAGHGLSRLSSVLALSTSTYVRHAGVATPVTSRIGPAGWFTVLLVGVVLAAGLGWMLSPTATILALGGLAAGHVLMRVWYERRLGGYTGDTLGAVQQSSEIGLYLGLCAWT